MNVQHDLPTTTITYFEEKRIDGGFYFGRIINGQKFLSDEIDVALIFDPVREVGVIRRIVPRKDPIEVSSDGQQLVVVAERNVVTAIVVADSVGGVMQDEVCVRGEGVIGPFQMGFPALVGRSARQLLVKKTNPPSAIDGEARVRRRWNGAQIVAAPGDATIAGFAHVKREMGGICSVSPGKIDPLAVVWIHGYRDSAPDFLISKGTNTKRNQSVGHNPHSGHSVSHRRGWLTERSKGTTRTGSKVVVANYDHVAGIWNVVTFRPAKERRVNRAGLMNGRAHRGRFLPAGVARFDTLRRESSRNRSRRSVKRPLNGRPHAAWRGQVAVPDVNLVSARSADRLHVRLIYTLAAHQLGHGNGAGKIIGPQNGQHIGVIPSLDSRVKHVARGAKSERDVVCAGPGDGVISRHD